VSLAFHAIKPGPVSFSVYNLKGQKITAVAFIASEGNNQFPLHLPSSIPTGQYFIREENSSRSVAVLKK
jgi:hypothetical protein